MRSSKKIALWFALIGVLIAALYGQFLHNPIVFDDQTLFVLSRYGHLPIEIIGSWTLSDLRALPYLTLAWSAQVFGFSLPAFRIENLLLHWSVVIALCLFVLRLYRAVLLNPSVRGEPFDFVRPEPFDPVRPEPVEGTNVAQESLVEGENDAQESPVKSHSPSTLPLVLREVEGAGRTALMADTAQANTGMVMAVLIVVSLFALHPLAIYAVGYLVQRTIVMATLFSVLAMWAYLHGSDKQSSGWLWSSVAMYFLATHSKEHVIMLPAILVAMTVLIHEDWRTKLLRSWPIFMAFAAIALFTIAQRQGVIGQFYEVNSAEMLEGISHENAHWFSVLTQCWLFFKYGLLWLLPNPGWMSVDMREPLAQGLFSVYGLALLAYLAYGFVAIKLLIKRNKSGLIGFAMLFPWLMFMTEFSTPRVQEIFVLYRSYFWALGGVIVLPLVLMQLNARLTMLISVLIAATLFMVSMERLASFSHPILLWDDAEKLIKDRQTLPGVSRIYYNRGAAWLYDDRVDLAMPDLLLAVKLSPSFAPAYFNLGNAYYKSNQHEQAIQAYSRAISLNQEQKVQPNFRYYFGRAASYEAEGKWLEAADDYKVSCLLNGKVGCDKAGRVDQLP